MTNQSKLVPKSKIVRPCTERSCCCNSIRLIVNNVSMQERWEKPFSGFATKRSNFHFNQRAS